MATCANGPPQPLHVVFAARRLDLASLYRLFSAFQEHAELQYIAGTHVFDALPQIMQLNLYVPLSRIIASNRQRCDRCDRLEIIKLNRLYQNRPLLNLHALGSRQQVSR